LKYEEMGHRERGKKRVERGTGRDDNAFYN
jgi:hypothetical protein